MLVQHVKAFEQARQVTSPGKINVTCKSPVGDISVVTLIRTDTTLDHSQKAEKVCHEVHCAPQDITLLTIRAPVGQLGLRRLNAFLAGDARMRHQTSGAKRPGRQYIQGMISDVILRKQIDVCAAGITPICTTRQQRLGAIGVFWRPGGHACCACRR